MTLEPDLTKIFTGRDVLVHILKDELETVGIGAMIRDDFYSGALAGFGGTPNIVDLFVLTEDHSKAEEIVNDFIERNLE
ncbi:MAG: hypothetical protein FD155_494 [Bacteroidetes bacterium]|nr:MAG: hypothetical protein FD155_494 [Bacteroidota bacterium]